MQPITGRGDRRSRRELLPGEFGVPLESLRRPVRSAELFGNDRPLELEIGSGKGTFLVSESQRRPEVNFLGLEYARRYFLLAADRLRRNHRTNARLVRAEARTFVRDFLEDASLSAVHVYFPDPWPKTRHHKRRLLNAEFFLLLAAKMEPRASVRILTDHEDYFSEIAEAIARSPLLPSSFVPTASAEGDELVGTNFARKYRKEGRRLFALAARKAGRDAAAPERHS